MFLSYRIPAEKPHDVRQIMSTCSTGLYIIFNIYILHIVSDIRIKHGKRFLNINVNDVLLSIFLERKQYLVQGRQHPVGVYHFIYII